MNLKTVSGIFDDIIAQAWSEYPLPNGLVYGSALWKNATFMGEWYTFFTTSNNKKQMDALAQFPLTYIVNSLKDKKANPGSSKKLHLLSTHDSNLRGILGSLNISTWECLQYDFFDEGRT